MKTCFKCKKKLPLDRFHKIPEKDYQLASDQGCATNCKHCTYDQIILHKGKLHPYLKRTKSIGNVRRFTMIDMNEQEAYDYCFNMNYESQKDYTRKRLKEKDLEPFNE
jgi:hypothetical protein